MGSARSRDAMRGGERCLQAKEKYPAWSGTVAADVGDIVGYLYTLK